MKNTDSRSMAIDSTQKIYENVNDDFDEHLTFVETFSEVVFII